MRKNFLTLLVSLVMSANLCFAFTTQSPQTGDKKHPERSIAEEATRIYSTLSSLTLKDRKTIFLGLTPEIKSELWKAHLKSYLSKHPDLTQKQTEAIQSLIAFVTPQLFNIPDSNPDFQTKIQEPLEQLTQKLLEVFSPKVAHELLEVLGGPEPQKVSTEKISLALKSNPRSALQPDCTCATRSDLCAFWYGEHYRCEFGGLDSCQWTAGGCGRFWLSSCDGMCLLIG